ncbi:MAG: type VI secretion system tip protein TssI/VgrG [Planctomycetota bacterium]|nr:type VI secretion system tip protein TssI/VgrG [Planctomycetota bacterium]
MPTERTLKFQCPLGPDVFLLDSFSGTEGLSQLFSFQLQLVSDDAGIAPKDMVGKPVTFSVDTPALGLRHFHGRVRQFRAGEVSASGLRRYQCEVVPWMWLLTRRQGSRIFQGKTPVQIAEAIFGELSMSDFRVQVRGQVPTLEYCVQFRESDYAFLCRLFEEHGIFWHFEHAEDSHVLVLSDSRSAFTDCDETELKVSPTSTTTSTIHSWERTWELPSGKVTERDYDFTKSATLLESTVSTVLEFEGADTWEIYDPPGRWSETGDGDTKVTARMEALEAAHDLVAGHSSCISFRPAGKFSVTETPGGTDDGEWAIVQVSHEARESSTGAGGYSNTFTCMPATRNYRPLRRTPRPLVHGLQSALVTGPSGEEIHTDEFGRIKLQFHWDREGQKDDASSCWVRVAQPWAGKSFGAFHLPRVGQEVLVAFLDGDPDRPLVVGSVYNDVQLVPFGLPGSKTQTGIRTRSSPGGGADNCNELRFEDKAGEEQVFLHAEKDELHEVENDLVLDVGHDQTITVGNNRTESVEKDRTLTVTGNKTETVEGEKSVTLKKNLVENVEQNRTREVKGDESVTVKGKATVAVTKDYTVGVDGATSIASKGEIGIVGQDAMTIGVDKDLTVSVTGAHASSAKTFEHEISDEAVITVGKAKITLKSDGTVTIEGDKITLKASGDIVLKGGKVAMN